MKIISLILFLIILLPFDSCKIDNYPKKIADITLTIKMPFAPVHNSVNNNVNTSILALQTLEDKNIHIYKFDTGGMISSYTINSANIYNAWFFQLFIKSVDSIIVFNSFSNNLKVIDSSGFVKKKIQLSQGSPTTNPEYANGIRCWGNNIFISNSEKYHNVSKKSGRSYYYKNVKPVYQVDLVLGKKSMKFIWGSFPTKYTKENKDYSNVFPAVCPYTASKVLVSFAADDSIYLFENGIKKRSFLCRSQYINKFIPYPEDKRLDMAFYKSYMTIEPKYLGLIHDIYTNRFYRIVRHRFKYKSVNQLDKNNMTWSIIIMNSDFNVIKEDNFDYRYDTPKVIIPSVNGVYISKTHDSHEEADKLTLTLFNL